MGGFSLINASDLDEAIAIANQIPAVQVGTVEIRPVLARVMTQTETPKEISVMTTTITTHEAQIRQLITDQQHAICSKNVDQILSRYAAEVIIFDAIPPFQTQGKAALRQAWEACFPYFPDSFGMETKDLRIFVNDNLAIAHWLFRFNGQEDHPAMQTWMRVTAVCQKHQDNWQIVHEHLSVPFDPETSQAAFTLNP